MPDVASTPSRPSKLKPFLANNEDSSLSKSSQSKGRQLRERTLAKPTARSTSSPHQQSQASASASSSTRSTRKIPRWGHSHRTGIVFTKKEIAHLDAVADDWDRIFTVVDVDTKGFDGWSESFSTELKADGYGYSLVGFDASRSGHSQYSGGGGVGSPSHNLSSPLGRPRDIHPAFGYFPSRPGASAILEAIRGKRIADTDPSQSCSVFEEKPIAFSGIDTAIEAPQKLQAKASAQPGPEANEHDLVPDAIASKVSALPHESLSLDDVLDEEAQSGNLASSPLQQSTQATPIDAATQLLETDRSSTHQEDSDEAIEQSTATSGISHKETEQSQQSSKAAFKSSRGFMRSKTLNLGSTKLDLVEPATTAEEPMFGRSKTDAKKPASKNDVYQSNISDEDEGTSNTKPSTFAMSCRKKLPTENNVEDEGTPSPEAQFTVVPPADDSPLAPWVERKSIAPDQFNARKVRSSVDHSSAMQKFRNSVRSSISFVGMLQKSMNKSHSNSKLLPPGSPRAASPETLQRQPAQIQDIAKTARIAQFISKFRRTSQAPDSQEQPPNVKERGAKEQLPQSEELDGDKEERDAKRFASRYHLQVSEVKVVQRLFHEYGGADSNLALAPHLAEVLLKKALSELYPAGGSRQYMMISTSMNLPQILEWIQCHSFDSAALVPSEQKKIRDIAKRWNAPFTEVEDLHTKFNKFDTDGGGNIGSGEFRQMMHHLLKAPAGVEFPRSRMDFFWKEADKNGNGSISFEEFFCWYRRYFSIGGGSEDGLASYAASYGI